MAVGLVVLAALLWGSSFAMTRIALRELEPTFVAWARTTIGALVVGIWWLISRSQGPVSGHPVSGRHGLHWAIGCGLATGIALLVITQALTGATSGATGIVAGLVPVLTVVIAARTFKSTVHHEQVVGLVLGVASVAALTMGRTALSASVVLLLLAAAVGHASSNLAAQVALRALPTPKVVTIALGVSSLMLLGPAVLHAPKGVPSSAALVAVTLLGALPTGLAYVCFFTALDELGAARASFANYLIPPTAVVTGIVVLHEQVQMNEVLALFLGLAAVATGTRRAGSADRAKPGRLARLLARCQ